MRKVIPTEGILHTVLSSEWDTHLFSLGGGKRRVWQLLALYPGPLRGRRKGLVPIACACTNYPKKTWGAANYCTLFHPPPAGKGTMRCQISVASYPCPREEGEKAYSSLRHPRFSWGSWRMRMQYLFPLPSGPGYEARQLHTECAYNLNLLWNLPDTFFG